MSGLRARCNPRYVVLAMTISAALLLCYNMEIDEKVRRFIPSLPSIRNLRGTSGTRTASHYNTRKMRVAEVCRRWKMNNGLPLRTSPIGSSFLDEVHNLSYCGIQKVACTFWKRAFLIATGMSDSHNPYDIPMMAAHTSNKHKHPSRDTAERNWTSFMFVRNPWLRIYSGYVDKILSLDWGFKPDRDHVRRFHQQKLPDTDTDCMKAITFQEFIRYITYLESKHKGINGHFSPMHTHCKPCQYKYDFIGKMETFGMDSADILKIMNLNYIYQDRNITNRMKDEDDIKILIRPVLDIYKSSAQCLKEDALPKATWYNFKLSGLIHKDTPQPPVLFHDEVTERDLLDTVLKAREDFPADARDRKLSRDSLMLEQYLTLNESDIDQFYETFRLDFELFGYDKVPSILGDEILH